MGFGLRATDWVEKLSIDRWTHIVSLGLSMGYDTVVMVTQPLIEMTYSTV